MQIRSLLIVGLLLVLAACAEKGAGPVLSSGDRYVIGLGSVSGYRLGISDKIKVTVYNEPALSGEFGVGANGSVALPLIGEVPASGRSVSEFAADAQARLADGYLRLPKVSAEVSAYRPFFILGEIDSPGSYPYAVGLTAMNAIATAKGFTPRANREVLRIRRQGETKEVNYLLTPELLVYPGDTVRVGERFF
jgi:polysaccharide export outer membrane protein